MPAAAGKQLWDPVDRSSGGGGGGSVELNIKGQQQHAYSCCCRCLLPKTLFPKTLLSSTLLNAKSDQDYGLRSQQTFAMISGGGSG